MKQIKTFDEIKKISHIQITDTLYKITRQRKINSIWVCVHTTEQDSEIAIYLGPKYFSSGYVKVFES